MEQSLLAVDVVLVLKGEQQRMAEVGLQRIASGQRWPMLILADTDSSSEKLLERVDRRVLDERRLWRRRDDGGTEQIYIGICAIPYGRITPCDEDLGAVELEQNRVPAHVTADDSFSDVALA